MIDLSIICPVYNEKEYINSLCNSFLSEDEIEKEVLFVDGGSTDGSVEVIRKLSGGNNKIKLIENKKRFVNFGFNMAYPVTKGRFIALLGAHSDYPKDFFKIGIAALDSKECDAVGGPLKQVGKTDTGKAIASCLSSKFGVGDTEFRVYKDRMYVDSVAFAIYRREVFENIGLLDEDLIRNQDDEFHYRLNKAGFKILMIPEMESRYYVRDTLRGVAKQYFNYGLYKPLVLKKIRKVVSIRHFIPAFFVLYLLSLPLVFLSWLMIIPILCYLFLNVFYSMKVVAKFKIKLTCLIVFPILHISYGLGFLFGLLKS